jgi:AcrR family transcriptional regulator
MAEQAFPKASDSADERKQHIARAAADIIASKGLEALTMRSIAATAGCSRGLVEHYFKNKAALVSAADAWANASAIARASTAIAEARGLSALEIRLRHILPFTETILDEWRVRVVFWRKSSVEDMLAKGESPHFRPVYEAIFTDIETAQGMGEVPEGIDCGMVAEFVLFTVIGISCSCLGNSRLRQERSLEERVQMISALLRSGDLAVLRFSEPSIY